MKQQTENKRLIKGIDAYQYEQNVLLRLLRKYGELTDDRFDEIFSDYKDIINKNGVNVRSVRRAKLRFMTAPKETFILGKISGIGYWSKWLELAQIMEKIGLLKIIINKGKMSYMTRDETANGN